MIARLRSGPGSNPARPFESIDDNLELRSPLVAFPRRQHDHHFARGRALHRDPIFNPFGPPTSSPSMDSLALLSFLSDLYPGSSTFSPPLIGKHGRIFSSVVVRDHIVWRKRNIISKETNFSETRGRVSRFYGAPTDWLKIYPVCLPPRRPSKPGSLVNFASSSSSSSLSSFSPRCSQRVSSFPFLLFFGSSSSTLSTCQLGTMESYDASRPERFSNVYPIAFIDLVQRRWLPLFHESATVNSGMSIERPMKNKRDDFVSCLGRGEEGEDRSRVSRKKFREEDKGKGEVFSK